MTARVLARASTLHPEAFGALAALAAAGVAAAALGRFVADPLSLRLAIVAALTALAVGAAATSPRALLFGLVAWLAALALFRRLVDTIAADTSNDVLLLVGPLVLVLLVATAAENGGFARRGLLANAVLVLSALTLAGAANPLQGSLSAGLAGLLFVLVPLLAFWVGRGLCDDRTLRRILLFVAALGVPASLYGLAQTYVAFPSWDAHWARSSFAGYSALSVNGTLRPFSSFSSSAEYSVFLALAVVLWVAFGLRWLRIPFVLGPIGLLAAALFLSSTRGAVVVTVVGLSVMAAARLRLPILPALSLAALMLFGLSAGVRSIADESPGAGPTEALVTHQVRGLADPLDRSSSTLGVHFSQVVNGLRAVRDEPLGVGVGTVSLAAVKFGGELRGTEADPSNVAVALGLPGLAVYLVILVVGFRGAYDLARRRRDALSLAAVGVLAVTALQWLNGGQYAVALLPWLVLGWVDRSAARR